MKKIEICIGTDRERTLSVRLSLVVVEDGSVVSERYHRINIPAGYPLNKAREAVEFDIARPREQGGIPGAPWPKIPDEEWAEVEQIASILHTPERIQKRREFDLKNAEFMQVKRK